MTYQDAQGLLNDGDAATDSSEFAIFAAAANDQQECRSYLDGLREGLEVAAKIADHIGIKDVNIDCRSGAKIAHAIRIRAALIDAHEIAEIDSILNWGK